jgi:hypothetical protein
MAVPLRHRGPRCTGVVVTPVCHGSGMETTNEDTLVSSQFEPCAEFVATSVGEPVCGCGWLETEHELPSAEVHALPVRRARRAAPKRLAS